MAKHCLGTTEMGVRFPLFAFYGSNTSHKIRARLIISGGQMIQPKVANATIVKVGTGVGLVALAGIGVAVAHVAITLITVAAYVVGAFLLYKLIPSLFYAVDIAGRTIENEVTKARPLEALYHQKDEFEKLINESRNNVSDAAGKIATYEKTYKEKKQTLSPEKQQEWEAKIASRKEGLDEVKKYHHEMIDSFNQFCLKIEEAETELSLAAIDDSLSENLGASGTPDISDKTKLALKTISDRIESSSAKFQLALSERKMSNA